MKVFFKFFKKLFKKNDNLKKLEHEYRVRVLKREILEGEVGVLYLADDPILKKLEEEIEKMKEL